MVTETRTNTYYTRYLFIFPTQYMTPVFKGKEKQEYAEKLFFETAKEIEIDIQKIKIKDNYIITTLSFPPKLSISDVVKRLKGTVGLRWFKKYPEFKKNLYRGRLWHRSYFASTLGDISNETINNYLDNQIDTPPQ